MLKRLCSTFVPTTSLTQSILAWRWQSIDVLGYLLRVLFISFFWLFFAFLTTAYANCESKTLVLLLEAPIHPLFITAFFPVQLESAPLNNASLVSDPFLVLSYSKQSDFHDVRNKRKSFQSCARFGIEFLYKPKRWSDTLDEFSYQTSRSVDVYKAVWLVRSSNEEDRLHLLPHWLFLCFEKEWALLR